MLEDESLEMKLPTRDRFEMIGRRMNMYRGRISMNNFRTHGDILWVDGRR